MNGTRCEQVGKVFLAIARDLRLCLICESVFTPMEAAEHSTMPCKYDAARAVLPSTPDVTSVMSFRAKS